MPEALLEAATSVANALHLPADWLNAGPAELFTMGLPEGFAHILAQSDTGAAQGGLFDGSGQLAKLIQRPTTTLRSVLQAHLATV